MIGEVQALMDRGVAFHRIETKETGKIRKRVAGQPIGSTDEIEDRRLLINDAEIEKLLPTIWTFVGITASNLRRRSTSRNGARGRVRASGRKARSRSSARPA